MFPAVIGYKSLGDFPQERRCASVVILASVSRCALLLEKITFVQTSIEV
jgi:hypothetical protein